MSIKERLVKFFVRREVLKRLIGWLETSLGRALTRKESRMFKKMLLDNWFTSLMGVLYAAITAWQTGGLGLKEALIAGVLVAMKDNIPGLGSGGGGQ